MEKGIHWKYACSVRNFRVSFCEEYLVKHSTYAPGSSSLLMFSFLLPLSRCFLHLPHQSPCAGMDLFPPDKVCTV